MSCALSGPSVESPVSCTYNMHTISVSRTRGQEKRGSGYNPPMTSCTAALLVALAAAVSACRPGESRAPQQDTAFAGTLAPVQRVRSFQAGVSRPLLRHVETRAGESSGGGYVLVVVGVKCE